MPLRRLFNRWHHWSFIPPQLRWLYVSALFQNLAFALLFLVGPIFLFQTGSSNAWQQGANDLLVQAGITSLHLTPLQTGILTVAAYYFLLRFFHVLLVPLTAQLLPKISLNVAMILGMAGYFLSSIMLPLIPQHPWLLLLTPLVRSSIFHWYWTPYYILLASEIDLDRAGSEMSGLEIIGKLATLLGPLLGAILSLAMGYSGVFWIGAGVYLLAMFSLFQLPNIQIRTQWHWSDWWEAVRSRLGRKQLAGLAGFGWENIGATIIWPLFLFIFVDNIVEVGYIITGATLISMLFVYITGWIFDHQKHPRRWSIGSGSLLVMLWGLRVVALQLPVLAVAVEAFDKVFAGMYKTVFSSLVVLRARANNAVLYSINRQVTFSLVNIIGWIVLVVLTVTSFSTTVIFATFILAMLVSLFFVQDERLRYRR